MISTLMRMVRGPSLGSPRIRGDAAQARAIANAIAHPEPSEPAAEFERRIEALRAEMLASDAPLPAWERPWLAGSDELRQRFKVSGDDSRFEVSMTIERATRASKGRDWCRALLSVTRLLKPRNVLEMGTNVGISGLYIAAGLELNGSGRLITLEGSPSKSDVARANFRKLGVDAAEVVTGDFADTLEPALERLAPLDLAFIDGFHDGDATVRYHRLCKDKARAGAVLIYDDINWSEGMARAWQRILADPDVRFSLDYGRIGICGLA